MRPGQAALVAVLLELGRKYRVHATLTLSVATGRMGGVWSDAFVERVFPAAERSQALIKEIAF